MLPVLAVLATRMHAFGREKKRDARCLQNLHTSNCRLKVCHAGLHMYTVRALSENSRAGSKSLCTYIGIRDSFMWADKVRYGFAGFRSRSTASPDRIAKSPVVDIAHARFRKNDCRVPQEKFRVQDSRGTY